jgi:low affinity Fe/Cu permease
MSDKKKGRKRNFFTRFSIKAAKLAGSPSAFMGAVIIVLIWALLGPAAGFGNTWQLVINTGTTIVTFLMVFLIQSTQNRDTEAMQIKLDELIRAVTDANDALLDLEELDEKQLDQVQSCYRERAERARRDGIHLDPPSENSTSRPNRPLPKSDA